MPHINKKQVMSEEVCFQIKCIALSKNCAIKHFTGLQMHSRKMFLSMKLDILKLKESVRIQQDGLNNGIQRKE